MNNISIVIGSWGSYNVCNERALGSKWLDLSDFANWEEIEQELISEGFELDGIDEELFIQDIDGLPSNGTDWDYMNPQTLFETLQESEVLTDAYKFQVMEAFIEVRSLDDFVQRVKDCGRRWNDDIYLYRGYSREDYGIEIFDNNSYELEESLLDYFDFERYGEAMGIDCAETYSGGIIEIIG